MSFAQRPNILLIVVDCLRADRCPEDEKGDELVLWRKLLREGSCFTQMISSASATPICFASLLTGQYSFAHGIRSFEGPAIRPGLETLAGILQQHGYHTNAYVTGPLIDVMRLNTGFEFYEHRSRDDYVYTDWGRKFRENLTKRPWKEPWFTLLHLWEVHMPRQLNGQAAPATRPGRYDLAWRQLDKWLMGMVEKLPEDTVIVLTADHGETIETPADRTRAGKMYKRLRKTFNLPKRPIDWKEHGSFVFEELIRIPFCISGPDIPHNICREQVRQIDIMPTILEIAGVKNIPEMHGRSLASMMQGEDSKSRDAFIEAGSNEGLRHWHSLRKSPWKYVERPRSAEYLDISPMLFNFMEDPLERHNVLKKHPQTGIRMRQELDKIIYSNPLSDQQDTPELTDDERERLEKQLRHLGYMD